MTAASFTPETAAFLAELEAENTAAWFGRNRQRYEEHVAAPAKALVGELAVLLPDATGLDVRAEPKVGRSLFRINRDTRFTADKTPYKTYVDFLFWVGDGSPREQPAFIMRLMAAGLVVGAGQMGVRGPSLDRLWRDIADRQRGGVLRRIVDDLVANGADLSEASRANVPRPYPADHPNADLLRRDGFHLARTVAHPAELNGTSFAGWCADALQPFSPLVRWLSDVAPR